MKINTECNCDSARFERVGGSLQPRIRTGNDLKKILELDPAQWAVTSIEITKYSCDTEFLSFGCQAPEVYLHQYPSFFLPVRLLQPPAVFL